MTLVVRPGFNYDADASAYIDAVEAADQADTPGIGAMETAVRYAINDFVIGCKNDGIWTALKNSCILAGAKTLEGSFIDLKSCTKVLTNNNFADGTYSGSNYTTGDYNRKTGLAGNSSTKYLNSNKSSGDMANTNTHFAVFPTAVAGGSSRYFLGATDSVGVTSNLSTVVGAGAVAIHNRFVGSGPLFPIANSLYGASTTASSTTGRSGRVTYTATAPASTMQSLLYYIFAQNNNGTPNGYATSGNPNAFYSIGESLNLALLDARVTDLVNAIGVAIP
jgi:hypothetical protein